MFSKIINKFFQIQPQVFDRKRLIDIVNKGDVVIDCGANTGQEVRLVAPKGAEIYAFEPNPDAFARLKENFGKLTNVHLFQKAVHNQAGKMKLFLHENADQDRVKWSTGSSLLTLKGNISKDNFVEVEVVDLGKFIENLNKPIKVLKMDVEGVEFDILEDLITKDLIKNIEYILVETHEQKTPELRPRAAKLKNIIKQKNIKNIYLNWE